ncbi:NAD-dependent epimerase/dehydratase family protein [Crystallibacter degradans]|uniref:NAD-dependent epimerase/dehydratase family protein n=1 Tax=Crystallibacter degradans TaxID=2726743 RepID=UPI0014764270|nr:NAD-dependent epimerase/dehydratase family protein [Arthrobacter sp. SF27]NMR28471.1 NAD-dependent epimerase/dehydratase family protein [Arthrobacter sp. SF27]
MKILVLGGTAWLGGKITTAALRLGHDVTALARGESGPVPDGAVFRRADRDLPDAYAAVGRQSWDAVVDVSSQPGQVRRAAEALAGCADRYIFVSSCSVYAGHDVPGADESAPLLPALNADVMASMETYGEAKAACEQHVLDAFGPGRAIIARAGLIAGPGDVSDRTGYWPLRFARPAAPDDSVLVPDAPELATQVIDVRDLAAWLVGAAERKASGTFNAVGEPMMLSAHLELARQAAGHTGPVVSVAPQRLADAGVNYWSGERSLPLWLPLPEYSGFASRDNRAAVAAGLKLRPLAETLADVLDWEQAAGPDRERKAGLTAQEERELLAAL